jgi:hypothetical protein
MRNRRAGASPGLAGRRRAKGEGRRAKSALAVAGILLVAAQTPPKETVERLFKAVDRRDGAAIEALVAPTASLWKPGVEKPLAEGPVGVREFLLGRFAEFPNWSSKLGERIAAGNWVAVRERAAMERGEKPRETLFLFLLEKGVIGDAWVMEGDGEGGGEGGASLMVEKWNERDMPRWVALFDPGASILELPSGRRLAAGEDEIRDLYETAFDDGKAARYEVLDRMSLSPWIVYRAKGTMDAVPASGETLTLFEVRGGLVRRVWFAR